MTDAAAAGNSKLTKRLGVGYEECLDLGTIVYIAIDGKYAGYILIPDRIRGGGKRHRGWHQQATSKKAADNVAAMLGIDKVYPDQYLKAE